MEAIGLAASLVALIEAAGTTAKFARTICQRMKNAPMILSAIAMDLHLIHSGLQQIERLQSCGANGFITPDDQRAVLATLYSAQSILRSIETTCATVESQLGKRKLIRWAMIDHPDVEKQMGELRATQSSLKTLFQIIGL
ncbi:hypothetical protein CGCTS75_v012998 [Colletotrichum tropicale]|nr:hypothetical protein CGCTS75_v012998 [Colletotrichum tropicale]